MSWISELQKVKKALDTVPFGWHYDADGHCTGFSYGDVLMMKGGGDLPVGTGDQTIRRLYRPTGRIEPWIAGCKMITDQGRPALEAVVAASFGAPLMMAAGEYSGVLSAWGESGIGKSSAVKVGMAVWGHPKLGKETQITTAKSALQKMGELKNLPLYWDEISNPAIQKHLFVAMDNATQGVEGGRLRSDTTQRSRGDWQTLVIACANLNFVDYVTAHQASTDAGVYRVFEIKVDEPTGAAGRLHTVDASAITADLERNYGRMGLAYSRMLADDPDKITEYVKDVVKQIGKEVGQTEPERFWAAVAGTTLAGAKLANELGASFNIEPLHKFLVEQYLENRRRNSSEATKGGGKDNTEDVLTNWLRDQSNTTLFTDKFWQGHGKPSGVTALFGPRIDLNKGITTQWSLDDKTLRISRTKLNSYLNENKISPSHVRDGLVKFFGASVTKASLGIGTNYVQGREHVYVIPVKEGTSLWNIMHAHKSPMEPKLAVQANADAGASQSA